MKLNKENKSQIRIGDKLVFNGGSEFIITNVIKGKNESVCFTMQNVKTYQTIYAYPSSKCYGAEIIADRSEETKKHNEAINHALNTALCITEILNDIDMNRDKEKDSWSNLSALCGIDSQLSGVLRSLEFYRDLRKNGKPSEEFFEKWEK